MDQHDLSREQYLKPTLAGGRWEGEGNRVREVGRVE